MTSSADTSATSDCFMGAAGGFAIVSAIVSVFGIVFLIAMFAYFAAGGRESAQFFGLINDICVAMSAAAAPHFWLPRVGSLDRTAASRLVVPARPALTSPISTIKTEHHLPAAWSAGSVMVECAEHSRDITCNESAAWGRPHCVILPRGGQVRAARSRRAT